VGIGWSRVVVIRPQSSLLELRGGLRLSAGSHGEDLWFDEAIRRVTRCSQVAR
jgi:hypothetical protein